ncbi:hypothetical protein Q427_15340 [Halomonas sp. BC04]|nr:hypothetical protein Q427_15340 [Halomonas sp. BC04]
MNFITLLDKILNSIAINSMYTYFTKAFFQVELSVNVIFYASLRPENMYISHIPSRVIMGMLIIFQQGLINNKMCIY